MKVRTGFVSNSSSSSFVCVTSKSDHEKIMADISAKQAELIKLVIEEGQIGDMEVVYTGHMMTPGGDGTYVGIGYNNDFDIPEGYSRYDDGNDDTEEFWEALWEAEHEYSKKKKELGVKDLSVEFDL